LLTLPKKSFMMWEIFVNRETGEVGRVVGVVNSRINRAYSLSNQDQPLDASQISLRYAPLSEYLTSDAFEALHFVLSRILPHYSGQADGLTVTHLGEVLQLVQSKQYALLIDEKAAPTPLPHTHWAVPEIAALLAIYDAPDWAAQSRRLEAFRRSNHTPENTTFASLALWQLGRLLDPKFTPLQALLDSAQNSVMIRRMDDDALATNVPHVWKYHSPTGFEIGYGGSGPADLALNALIACGVPPELAIKLHQAFKNEFIANIGERNGQIALSEVLAWLQLNDYDSVAIQPVRLLCRLVRNDWYAEEHAQTDLPTPIFHVHSSLMGWSHSRAAFEAWLDVPKRVASPEYDYGNFWYRISDHGGESAQHRLSWIKDTGELYLLNHVDGEGFVFDDRWAEAEIEALLKGWAEQPFQLGIFENIDMRELRQPK
jgi:hypothetical protein